MSNRISDKIDKLLEDDRNFDTRAGLRLYAELVSDAFEYIEQQKTKDQSILTRLTNVENGLHDFMELRRKEQEKAETERVRWRWAIITPTIGLFFTTLGILISLWLGK